MDRSMIGLLVKTAADNGLSAEQLTALIDSLYENGTAAVPKADRRAADRIIEQSETQPVTRRRAVQHRVAQRKLYRVIRIEKGRGKGQPAVDPKLPPAYMAVYSFLLKKGNVNGVQSFDVTKALNIPHKTTESALHNLRVVGAVESFYPEGK